MTDIFSLNFLIAILQITIADILLGADNAILIALACRNLADDKKKLGILYGSLAAIILRIILVFFAVYLLKIPFLKFISGLILIKIGIDLLVKNEQQFNNIPSEQQLFKVIKTIVIADFIMSLDNVVVIASVATTTDTSYGFVLVVFGILLSVPIILFGSSIFLKILEKYPQISYLGAMLLGWIAGNIILSDIKIKKLIEIFIDKNYFYWLNFNNLTYIFSIFCVLFIIFIAYIVKKLNTSNN